MRMLLVGLEAGEVQAIESAVTKLKAFKQSTGHYNVKVNDGGLEWTMSLSTFDGKPFNKKRAIITTFYGMQGKQVAELTAEEAGYSENEVQKQIKCR